MLAQQEALGLGTSETKELLAALRAFRKGDLAARLPADWQGLAGKVADAFNDLADTGDRMTKEVDRVGQVIGKEGKLGGQAQVEGVSGTWKDLTDTINRMIANLCETTRKNADQDWLKTNLARLTGMLHDQKDLPSLARLILSELARIVPAQHGIFYIMADGAKEHSRLRPLATYACKERRNLATEFRIGEGLVGQCALEKQRILLQTVPGDYLSISSGLGEAAPLSLVLLPLIFKGQVKAVVELASFDRFEAVHISFLDQLAENTGIVISAIQANVRTEELLEQSQSLTRGLQSRQEELRQANEQLQEKARLLEEQKQEVESKNREAEEARSALEAKAGQLALISKYKSEFLANMSHELRTPLNSLLILSQQLADNPEGNLSDEQKEFAQTIYSSGSDLLALINDILDLSKVESGTVTVDVADVPLAGVRDQVEQMFRHMAQPRNLAFAIHIDPRLPRAIRTDPKRLLQVIKNLLANAFKFTAKGGIDLRVEPASSGWSFDHESLNRARQVIAFTVADTGIGIPADKQKVIFEAFQQADGSTSRKYGGTGLGLAISHEVAILLGGELRLVSSLVDRGSAFTLFLPIDDEPPPASVRADHPATESRPAGGPPLAGAAMPPARDPATAALKDKVVLLVDDDARNLLAIIALLQRHEVKVLTAESGKDALETLARGDGVDIILMDIMMPQMDGYATIAAVRQMPRFKGVPIIALTAKAMKGDREKCIQAGASDYIAKPVDPDQLLSLLHGCLYR